MHVSAPDRDPHERAEAFLQPWYAPMSEQIPVKNVTPAPAKDNNTVDLYASSGTIYTRAFTGIFRNLRMVSGAGLFLLYF